MSLLMPEYERQLRAAARRLARHPDEATRPVRASRGGGLGSRLFLALTGAIAVLVAVAAVVLIGNHGSPAVNSPGAALPAVQYDCAPHQILRTTGRLVPAAHGTVGGERWTFEVDSARHGLGSVQAGRFLLGGRQYGLCDTGLNIELVNAGPRGVVYGFAGRPYTAPIVVEASTGRGTTTHPVRASQYPAVTRQVAGAILFVRALPAPACAYRGLAVGAPRGTTVVGATEGTLTMTGPFERACAAGQLLQTPKQGSGPAEPQIAPPSGLSAHARAEFDAGRTEVGNSGCLACHQIGDQGNNGPGPELTHVGSMLSSRALASALVHPTAPMPSFQGLPARSRRAIVDFLRDLR
jgi:hypothetical protein